MSWNSFLRYPLYVVDADGSADWAGPWIECSYGQVVYFQASWAAVALTAGTLGVDGTLDPLKAAANVIPLAVPTGLGTWPNPAAAASTGAIVILRPMPFMRLTYVSGAGGAADQFQAFAEIRSQ